VQEPKLWKRELAPLQASCQGNYSQMDQARQRLLELLQHLLHRKEYRKRTEMALEIAHQREAEGYFPQANYVFDSGVLTLELARLIEGGGKHWVSAL
jgi:hypothetical protein